MNFKPGDKVWVDHAGSQYHPLPTGSYAAVLVRKDPFTTDADGFGSQWWVIEMDDAVIAPNLEVSASERILRRRDGPPPQQEPKQQREPVGEWELCPWRPEAVKELV